MSESVRGTHGVVATIVYMAFTIAVLVLVTSYLFTMIMGFGLVFLTPDGRTFSAVFLKPSIFLFPLIGFESPVGLSVGSIFSLVWIIYIACFMFAWKWRESFHQVVGTSFSHPFRRAFNNFLFIMPLISSMVLVGVLAIIYSQWSFGVPTGEPKLPEDPYWVFMTLAYSPVVEEVGFRLIPIGLFSIMYVFFAGRNVGSRLNLFLTALLYPEGAKRAVGLKNVGDHGLWRGINAGEWTMVLVTSGVFAFAHVISGIGWEVGKVTSVFVQGFFFGLTYLMYGFEAPILLHWFFNYYLGFFFNLEMAEKFFPNSIPIFLLMEFVIIILGVVGWLVFAYIGLQRLWRRGAGRKQPLLKPPP